MGYLFFQILVWILLAFGLGGIIGWLLRDFTQALQQGEDSESQRVRRGDEHIMLALLKSEVNEYKARIRTLEQAAATTDSKTAKPRAERPPVPDSWRPAGLPQPKGTADDLKKVRGIGPKIEQILNELGIYHYFQIAALNKENIQWLNNHLHFPGRIERERWVEQTRELVKQHIDRPETA